MTPLARINSGAALVLALGLPACSQPAAAATRQPIPVKVQSVAQGASASATRYSGALEPASQVSLAFRVGGYVEALGQTTSGGVARALDKGDFVRKGSVLARLRAADYEHKVATARAVIGEASAQSKLAHIELERAQKLFDAQVIAKASLDSSVAQADSASAALQDAQARTRDAELSLGDTVLRAPADGVILSRQVEVGSLVSPGQPALTIADTRTMKAVFGAPQQLVEKLHVGSPLQVFVGAEGESRAPEKLLAARVTRIAPAADSNGRVFSVEAALPNVDGALRAGAVVSVHVPSDAFGQDTLLVPLSSVIRSPRDPHGFAVFVLDGEGERAPARLLDVGLGEVIGNSVSVRAGLAPNQRVVSVGSTLLRDGSDAVVIR